MHFKEVVILKKSAELMTALEQLKKLNDSISVLSIIKAENLEEERIKWCESTVKGLAYNPKLRYSTSKVIGYESELLALRSRFEELPTENDCDEFIKQAILESTDTLLLFVDLASSIAACDDERSKCIVQKHLGRFSRTLVEKAKAVAEGENLISGWNVECLLTEDKAKKADSEMLGPDQLVDLFTEVMNRYGFTDEGWEVKTGTEYQNITVETKMNGGLVYVPSTRKPVKLRQAIALVGHEIEGHVRDNMNTAHLFSDQLGAPMELAKFLASHRNSILTEGLAKVSDITVSLQCGAKKVATPEPWYIIAEDMAMNGATFSETGYFIFNALVKKGSSPEKAAESAWKFTIRVYRGCTNTRNPKGYAWYGDKCYLEGFLQATELLNTYSSAGDYGKLYVEDFDTISKLIGTNIDEIAPKYMKLNIADELIRKI